MKKRLFLQTAAALAAAAAFGSAHAQTAIKFQLDWRFEGPAALFLQPAAKGYFKSAGLDVTIDSGNGSGGTVTRVASGTYDMGLADLAALMEFHANNPDAPNKPVAVMMVYNNTPAAVLALKKSGITQPADLTGKKMGAPVFDAGRKAFPIFQKANGIGNVSWTSMDPPLRETMLARGEVDARRHGRLDGSGIDRTAGVGCHAGQRDPPGLGHCDERPGDAVMFQVGGDDVVTVVEHALERHVQCVGAVEGEHPPLGVCHHIRLSSECITFINTRALSDSHSYSSGECQPAVRHARGVNTKEY